MELVKSVLTGTAALTLKVSAPERDKFWKIISAELHLNTAGGTGTFTITRNSNDGNKYSTLYRSVTMDTVTDYIWTQGDENECLCPSDNAEFYWLNSAGKTFGLTVITAAWG